MAKYFSRETAAAIVGVATLLAGEELSPETPFYYAAGVLEYEEYGLQDLVRNSVDEQGRFCSQRFVERGVAGISPLTSFKVLQNMTLAFVAIEYGLTGDNAVVYVSARSLLQQCWCAPTSQTILLGAGQAQRDGSAEAGFALLSQAEASCYVDVSAEMTAIDLLRTWSAKDGA
jgi:hypothetical protein